MKLIPASRNGEIDFLKFVFSIIIVIHHSYAIFDFRTLYFKCGSLAVEFFFIVSGYFFASSVMRKKEPYNLETIGSETSKFIFKKGYGLWFFFLFAAILKLVFNSFLYGIDATILYDKFSSIMFDLLYLNMTGIPTIKVIGASWYISAMLLSMAILYPIFRKKKDLFICVIAPIVSLFLYGIMMKQDGFFSNEKIWYGFVLKGVIRAFAGISLGCFAYRLSDLMQNNPVFTKSGKFTPHLLSVIQIACVVGSIRWMYTMSEKTYSSQPVIILMFAVIVVICTSKLSSISKLFSYSIFTYLGNLSMSIFLCHSPIISLMMLLVNKSDFFRAFRDSRFGPALSVTVFVLLSVAVSVVAIPICDGAKNKLDKYVAKLKVKE